MVLKYIPTLIDNSPYKTIHESSSNVGLVSRLLDRGQDATPFNAPYHYKLSDEGIPLDLCNIIGDDIA